MHSVFNPVGLEELSSTLDPEVPCASCLYINGGSVGMVLSSDCNLNLLPVRKPLDRERMWSPKELILTRWYLIEGRH